jgi:four helix bundle protein
MRGQCADKQPQQTWSGLRINRFEEIEAWRIARALARDVYGATRGPRFRHDFALRDQATRAAISAMANIAEGFDSRSNREFIRFLSYAYRSVTELQSHLYVARDQAYIAESAFRSLYDRSRHVHRLINGFVRYQKGAGAR